MAFRDPNTGEMSILPPAIHPPQTIDNFKELMRMMIEDLEGIDPYLGKLPEGSTTATDIDEIVRRFGQRKET